MVEEKIVKEVVATNMGLTRHAENGTMKTLILPNCVVIVEEGNMVILYELNILISLNFISAIYMNDFKMR